MELTQRQKDVLVAVIQECAKKGKPVSSKSLLKRYKFSCSPATIRSRMNFLEKEGFLKKPHISAGRIPTEKGYQLYVKELMKKETLPSLDRRKIKIRVNKIKKEKEYFSQELAEILADLSQALVFVGSAREKHFHFAGLEKLIEEADEELFREVARFLEQAEREFETFFEVKINEPKIFIGQDHPLLEGTRCGLILSPLKKGRQKSLIALLGPERMNYQKNLSLIDYINEILD